MFIPFRLGGQAGSGGDHRPRAVDSGTAEPKRTSAGLRHGFPRSTDVPAVAGSADRPDVPGGSVARVSGFVDECQLNVRAGDGGAGCVSFRREGPVAMGGPNGGDGGRGGDIWLVADHNVASLLSFRDYPHRRAGDGAHGKGKDLHGKRGADLEISVPEGTIVSDMYNAEPLAELLHHGDRWQAASGGRGGRGNARFLSNKRRAPSFAEQGEHGDDRWLKLEMRLIADVALVGFPNVGKSTLISVISAAKPKIANYPFTTLEPHLGVVRLDDTTEFVVADIPGLIEGASEGKGLGHQFLRHVERARVLCLMLDLAPMDGISVERQEEVLLRELGEYQPDLLDRPRLVAATKADAVEPAEMGFEPNGDDRLVISAVTGQGVRELVGRMAALVHEARQAEPSAESSVILRPTPLGSTVERVSDSEYRVVGRDVERVVALNDVTTPEALAYIDHRLERLGVLKLLARAGVSEGDVVWIGDFSFEFRDQ
jgi:GTP-binding protein